MRKHFTCFLSFLIIIFLFPLECFADENIDYKQAREDRKSLTIQSNLISNWPEGPEIGAYSAILMEMNTHTILYAKNIDEKMYPASTTKILTCLLAIQNCELNENVTYSYDATHNVPRDGSNMGMDTDEVITMEQSLYGVLVGSANEAASAVGEHVANKVTGSPSIDSFVNIMNDKAKALGCINSHFSNANGLFDENHYTCAYDLALIGCEFFQNETLCKMSSTNRYHIAATTTQPDDIWLVSKNQLYEGKSYAYNYLLGSKTGYLSQARETLVSGASKDGLNLVCVIFMEESPYQYEDTVALFQYGFENFKKVELSNVESTYSVVKDFDFSSSEKFFTDTNTFFSLDDDPYIILPKSASFEDVTSSITYNDDDSSDSFGVINYNFSNVNIGSCSLYLNNTSSSFANTDSLDKSILVPVFDKETINVNSEDEKNFIFINLKFLVIYIIIGIVIISFILFILSYISSFHFSVNHESDRRRKSRNKDKRLREKNMRKKLREDAKLRRQRRKDYKKRR